jgi:hypothetical protein
MVDQLTQLPDVFFQRTTMFRRFAEVVVLPNETDRVFMKAIPLSVREMENVCNVNNIFNLPDCYHYGVGSLGFSAWRELDACERVTHLVLSNQSQSFAIMHYWRIVRRAAQDGVRKPKNDHWVGALGYEHIAERENAPLSEFDLVMCFEVYESTFQDWIDTGTATADQIANIIGQLSDACTVLGTCNIVHMDLHWSNVMLDGDRNIYIVDMGLAMCGPMPTAVEEAFRGRHVEYDMSLFLRCFPYEGGPQPEETVPTVKRYASVIAVMKQFMDDLCDDKNTVFPEREMHMAWMAVV